MKEDKFHFVFSPMCLKITLVEKISGDKIKVVLRGTPDNPLEPRFSGKLLSQDNGTVLKGSFNISLYAVVIHIVWFFVLAYATFTALSYIMGLYERPFPHVYFWVFPLFWLGSILMTFWEIKTGRKSMKFMIDRFSEILNTNVT